MPRSIQKEFPKIFIDWHPVLNGKVNPSTLRRTSRKKYWWKCHSKKCGCNWQATINARIHLGDMCPKCIERKKKRFTQDINEVKKIFKRIKELQIEVDKCLINFTNDNLSFTKKAKNSVLIRKRINEINRLGLKLRKIILTYKKKIIGHKIEENLKNKKNE